MVLRDGHHGVETLLVKRNNRGSFADAWVFPGGAIEAVDWQRAEDEQRAAIAAAVRETQEETQLTLEPDKLIGFAHWTTPIVMRKRFATWFFVTGYQADEDVIVDGEEIVDFRWLSPAQALQEQQQNLLKISPPTYISLLRASEGDNLVETLGSFLGQVQHFTPKACEVNGQSIVLYDDDAGYATGNPQTPGPQHRMVMAETWQYIKTD